MSNSYKNRVGEFGWRWIGPYGEVASEASVDFDDAARLRLGLSARSWKDDVQRMNAGRARRMLAQPPQLIGIEGWPSLHAS